MLCELKVAHLCYKIVRF